MDTNSALHDVISRRLPANISIAHIYRRHHGGMTVTRIDFSVDGEIGDQVSLRAGIVRDTIMPAARELRMCLQCGLINALRAEAA